MVRKSLLLIVVPFTLARVQCRLPPQLQLVDNQRVMAQVGSGHQDFFLVQCYVSLVPEGHILLLHFISALCHHVFGIVCILHDTSLGLQLL